MAIPTPNPSSGCCVGGMIGGGAQPVIAAAAPDDPGVEAGGIIQLPNYIHTPTGQAPVWAEVTFDDAGVPTRTFYYLDANGDPQVSATSDFSRQASSTDVKIDDDNLFTTNVTVGDANYGLVLELEKRDTVEDGVITGTTYHLVRNVAAIGGARGDDVTALIDAAPWSGPETEEQSVIMPNINLTVTGATPLALPGIQLHAGYWRAEISNGNGVIYTVDGSVPTTTPLNGQLAPFGGVIVLNEDEGAAARFLPLDSTIQFNPAEATDLSFEQNNRTAK